MGTCLCLHLCTQLSEAVQTSFVRRGGQRGEGLKLAKPVPHCSITLMQHMTQPSEGVPASGTSSDAERHLQML